MDKKEQLKQLLALELKAYQAQTGTCISIGEDTALFGNGSVLDSIGLVMVLTGFEAKVNDALNTDLVLASEKAMSMVRSPFRNVGSLIEYTYNLLEEAQV